MTKINVNQIKSYSKKIELTLKKRIAFYRKNPCKLIFEVLIQGLKMLLKKYLLKGVWELVS